MCSDGFKAYAELAGRLECEHRIRVSKMDHIAKAKGGKPRRAGALGLGRVNEHHRRLKTVLNRQANGVSTAKLTAYLGWMRAMRRGTTNPTNLLMSTLIFRRRH